MFIVFHCIMISLVCNYLITDDKPNGLWQEVISRTDSRTLTPD